MKQRSQESEASVVSKAASIQQQDSGGRTNRWSWFSSGIGLLTLVASAISAVASAYAVREMRVTNDLTAKSVAATQEQLRQSAATQRAWIGIGGGAMSPLRSQDGLLSAVFKITNAGQTPALNVRSKVVLHLQTRQGTGAEIDELFKNFEPMEASTQQSVSVVLPGGTLQIDTSPERGIPDPVAYVIGLIYYNDITGVDHRTEVCFFTLGLKAGRWITCPGHNSMK